MDDLIKAKSLLKSNEYTCAFVKGNDIMTSIERGVKPLLSFYESKKDFGGFSAADKVVGKGAAFMYVLLKVKSLYADVISEPACEILTKYKIDVTYNIKVKNIINRDKTGFCPIESAVLNVASPDDAYNIIKQKLQTM